MKHAMTLLLCDGKLHYAPIGNNPGNIIDLGTSSHRYIRVKAVAKKADINLLRYGQWNLGN
jgi:hypothetical protein